MAARRDPPRAGGGSRRARGGHAQVAGERAEAAGGARGSGARLEILAMEKSDDGDRGLVGHARVVGRHGARRAEREKEDGTSGVRDREKFPESRV